MNEEHKLLRTGSVCAMLGVTLATGSAMLGPMDLDSHNIITVLEFFGANTGQLKLHGLGVSLGTLLILGGFVAMQRSLSDGAAGAWARLGLASAVVMTVIHLAGAMMGGSVMPALAESYLQALPEQSMNALWTGAGFYIFYEALLAPVFLTLSATMLLYGTAVVKSDRYPAWLGWAAIIPGMWVAAGWVGFVLAGPAGSAEVMPVFIPGFMLSMVWIFITGIFMFRMARINVKQTPVSGIPELS
jgi:hypothetical protein